MSGVPVITDFSEDDFRQTMRNALRMQLILTLGAMPFVGWKSGWPSVLLLAIGSAISASGLWEWLRLMSAVMARMDAGGQARPVAMVMIGFFLRLGVVVAVLYVSLKHLNGSVYALVVGLGLGVFCLTVQALRLVKAWTV